MNSSLIRIVTLLIIPMVFSAHAYAHHGSGSRTFKVQKGGTAEISLVQGNVHITGWNRDEVTIQTAGWTEDEGSCLDASLHGNTIHITMRGGCDDADLAVSVPSSFNVDVRTAQGEIQVDGSLTGSIKGSTSGGSIQLGNLGGEVEMQTAGGDISAGDIQGNASLYTSGGNIAVGKVGGETTLSSSGGDITAARSGGRIRAKTLGGNVTVGNVGSDADINTTGGDIELGDVAGNASLKTAGGDVTMRSARGTISASTAGGDIHLESMTGAVDAETAGGDVVVGLVPHGESSLSSAGGNIRLFIPDGTKVTVRARIVLNGEGEDSEGAYGLRSDFSVDNARQDGAGVVIEGTMRINGGGDEIRLDTHDGRIDVLRGKFRE